MNTWPYRGDKFSVEIRESDVRGMAHHFEVVVRPSIVIVIPQLQDSSFCLIQQVRVAAGATTWEFPAGSVEEGETTTAAAHRELREEAGLVATSISEIGKLHVAPHFSTEIASVFVARCVEGGPPEPEDTESIVDQKSFNLYELQALTLSGQLTDAKSLAALYCLIAHGMAATDVEEAP